MALPIPSHLASLPWYAAHLAWLKSRGFYFRHDPGDALPTRAVLTDAVLTRAVLTDAVLTRADLTDAVLTDAVLTRAVLTDAVLTGADLTGADLTRAVLTDAVLTDAVLTGAVLTDAVLTGADLTDADLTDAVLTDAVLTGADLTGADLTGADVPIVENIDAQILAAIAKEGCRLEMGSWHGINNMPCGTTHCRAGWAIVLAGEAGAKLEQRFGPGTAGALIYAKSDPTRPVPNFFATNDDAIADMKTRAGITA